MNSIWNLKVPSKIFFAGEYLALQKGPTLIGSFAPAIEYTLNFNDENFVNDELIMENLHPESPAGRLIAKFKSELSGWRIRSKPNSLQGFGTSVAEFYAVVSCLQIANGNTDPKSWNLHQLLNLYRECCSTKEGSTPSGADFIAQARGMLCYWNEAQWEKNGSERGLDTLDWNFAELEFIAVKLSAKLATHSHLKNISGIDFSDLRPLSEGVASAIKNSDSKLLLNALFDFREWLNSRGLQGSEASELEVNLSNRIGLIPFSKGMADISASILARGCGAMGADVALVFFSSRTVSVARICAELKLMGYETVFTKKQLMTGLELKPLSS